MQYYTSIEQSKKLLELGLNLNTADMCWTNHCYGSIRSSMRSANMTIDKYKKLLERFADSSSLDCFYPCWSLGALFDLLPKRISNQQLDIRINDYYQLGYGCYISKGWSIWVNTTQKKTLFEAVYDMVIWLLERNYI